MYNKILELQLQELDRAKRFFQALVPNQDEPVWATPGVEHKISSSVSLRISGEGDGEKVLIVTPQVNHSYIADFSKEQSLVSTLLAEPGIGQVATTNWTEPDPKKKHGIADSINDIINCINRLEGPVHIVGLCQGGWQAAIVAALRQDLISSLTIAAAPIDTHVGQTLLHAYTFGLPMSFFEALVFGGGGIAPGHMLSIGFDQMKPVERYFGNYAALYLNIDDEDFVGRYQDLRKWYQMNKGIAGDLYIETVRDLFKGNKLAKGELIVNDQMVNLARITCPVNLVAGTRDHITPQEQVFALESCAPKALHKRYLVDAGHIGVFMGRKSLKAAWPEIAQRMAKCDNRQP